MQKFIIRWHQTWWKYHWWVYKSAHSKPVVGQSRNTPLFSRRVFRWCKCQIMTTLQWGINDTALHKACWSLNWKLALVTDNIPVILGKNLKSVKKFPMRAHFYRSVFNSNKNLNVITILLTIVYVFALSLGLFSSINEIQSLLATVQTGWDWCIFIYQCYSFHDNNVHLSCVIVSLKYDSTMLFKVCLLCMYVMCKADILIHNCKNLQILCAWHFVQMA